MDENIASFGAHAGKIWNVLQSKGKVNEKILMKETKLTPSDLCGAIGWLAREDKIHRTNMMYQLGKTNLSIKIGQDAGKVWKVLDIWNDVDAAFIAQKARITEPEVFAALGWLGREDKLQTTMIQSQQGSVLYRLK